MIIAEIGGVEHPVKIDSLTIDDSVGERSICRFVIVNKDYDKEFVKGQPVKIYRIPETPTK